MKLLLFDIDGTLLRTNGTGRRLFEEVLTELCQRTISTAQVSFSGRTDPFILQETLEKAGLPPDEIQQLIPLALNLYIDRASYTPDDVQVLPGVRPLLDRLSHDPGVQLALLTGNLQHTAYLKLRSVALANYFPFGAFGSDHADRSQLPPIAVDRARQYNGHEVKGHDIIVIGDSIHDIHCGRGVGAFSVGVASGLTSFETLAAQNPDMLLHDLVDHELFFRRVLGIQT